MTPNNAALPPDPPLTALSSRGLAFARIAGFAAWTLACLPVQLVLLSVSRDGAMRFSSFFHRRLARILGFRIRMVGQRRAGATLFVANHLSYIDIVILGGCFKGAFISKAEVRSWPGFGFLAVLQRTVFIKREKSAARAQTEEIRRRLETGDSLMLFAEGTSSAGHGVLAFKSSLLAVAATEVDGAPVAVQPVTLIYDRLDGMPAGRLMRPFVSWFGDEDLASHLPIMLGLGRIGATVIFHTPLTLADSGDRKALTRRCEAAVRAGYESVLRGQPAAVTA